MRFSLLFVTFLIFFGFSANADITKDFFRLSNIKGALDEGDCERYGGYKYGGDVAKLAVKTSKRGKNFDNYRNVKKYKGDIYVLWSYRSGIGVRTMEWCIFK